MKSCLQEDFEEQMADGHMALFLPCLASIELYIREQGNLQCKAAVSIAKVNSRETGLLNVKAYLKEFDTTEALQAGLVPEAASDNIKYQVSSNVVAM